MSIKNKLRIMVVDDHRSYRMETTQILQDFGIKNVTIAKNGKDAFDKAVKKPVHLIITDLHMPHMNGLQLTKAIRAHHKIRKTGVIILTDKKDNLIVELAQSLGVSNVLSKPFSKEILLLAMETIVGKIDQDSQNEEDRAKKEGLNSKAKRREKFNYLTSMPGKIFS